MAQASSIEGIRTLLSEQQGSAFKRYRRLTYGDSALGAFLLFELANTVVLPLPGALGLAARRAFFRRFFGAVGRGVVIGRGCVFRHPRNIFLGDAVVIDEHCLLDARGTGREGLSLGDHTIVNRDCSIQSKGGAIRIGRRVSIGAGSHLVSWSGLSLGDDAALAGGCQISAGTFPFSDFNKPPGQRTPVSAGAIEIGAAAWLATGAIVLDAVRIGENAVVSAGSVVMHDVPRNTVVQGNPAKKIFQIR